MEDNGSSLSLDDDDDDSDYVNKFEEWELDEDILNRLKQNDPTIEKLYIRSNAENEDDFDANDINWQQEGSKAISKNTHIKSLSIRLLQNQAANAYEMYASEENAKSLLRAVSNNRTIRCLSMSGDLVDSGYMMLVLSSCFQCNRLLRFEVDGFVLCSRNAQMLENAFTKGNSLRIFKLKDSYGGDDESASKIVNSLVAHTNLRELELDFSNDIKTTYRWCSALGNLLQNTTKLAVLDLGYNHIDDMGADVLGKALGKNATLNKLFLCGIKSITSIGWAGIFQGLTNPRSLLEELDISSNELDDDAATAFAAAVIKIKSLKSLDLNFVKTSTIGWSSLLIPLLNSTDSILEKLVLRNSNIDDEGMTGLVDALGSKSSLKELNIGSTKTITRAGLVYFIRRLGNPISLLEDLDLSGRYTSGSIINDELAGALANALRTNTRLKRLNLSNCPAITPAGWLTFFDTVRNSNSSSLEKIFLYEQYQR